MTKETQERTPVSDGQTGIRQEIQDMILDTARHALEFAGKPPSSKDGGALIARFESMTRVYSGRHPLPDLLREMQAATEELLARKAGSRVLDAEDPTTSALWSHAAKKGAEEARERHLRKARAYFGEAREAEATKELCKAITCSVAAIAAQRGWPHQTPEDVDNAVTALATGTMPKGDDDIYELLQAASEQGQDLSSAFAAAMAQPGIVGDTLFYDGKSGDNEGALMFAERTIELAYQLADEPR